MTERKRGLPRFHKRNLARMKNKTLCLHYCRLLRLSLHSLLAMIKRTKINLVAFCYNLFLFTLRVEFEN
ncbi:hypothetical protein [Helicobacter rodentium]|uniref:hypothetical protein n=2 Tax=Helicobacter rodentium TaxID=59617 RepID=UPI002354C3EB|nr:hypothetical protein [Helicobacter rodentium]